MESLLTSYFLWTDLCGGGIHGRAVVFSNFAYLVE